MIALITNTIVPYCYDVPHILALPENLSHRFRYEKRWIDEPENIEKIKGKSGLVILRIFDTGELIPIRYVQIEDVIPFGDTYYIELRVKKFFNLAQCETLNNTLKKTLAKKGIQNLPLKPLQPLIFEYEHFEDESKKSQEITTYQKWDRIVKLLGEIGCYKDYSFFNIFSIKDSKEMSATISQDETGKHSLFLKPNCLYYLELIQKIPWEIDKDESIEHPFNVELSSEPDKFVLLNKNKRVVGKYDLLRFSFKTAPSLDDSYSFLEIKSFMENSSYEFELPSFFLPVVIQVPRWRRIVTRFQVGFLILFTSVFFMADLIGCKIQIESEYIRSFALLFLIIFSGKWNEMIKGLVKESKNIRI